MKKLIFVILLLCSLSSFGQSKKKVAAEKKEEVIIKEIEPKIISPESDNTEAPTEDNDSDNTIYNAASVEVQAEFPGGMSAMSKYVSKNFKIPEELTEQNGAQKIFTQFVVEKDGAITNIKIVRDAGVNSGNEAIRLLKSMPKWLPAELNGHHVRSLYSLPLTIYGSH